jgi:electron transfer flavoprotein alpha subunit
MSTLVVAEHVQGGLSPVTLELLSAARELSPPVSLVLVGRDAAELGLERAAADEILQVPGPAEFDPDVYRRVLATLISERQPVAVLAGFSANAMAFAPAVAAKLGLGLATDVFGLSGGADGVVANRGFHAGKVHGEVKVGGSTAVLLLRPGVWPEAPEGKAPPTALTVTVEDQPSRTRHREFTEPTLDGVDITTADVLLSIGRGVGEQETVAEFEELAEQLGAGFAVSRPLVDAGWVSSARQVGQSGRTVSPRVYLAFGISGAVQHIAGMKNSSTIIAVNNDPNAAIFDVAHYGAVADILDIADELAKLV